MKKFLLCAVIGLTICLCGCTRGVTYTTKYIVNCVSAEFRQEPSNAATILNDLMHGEIVSFEKDVENGYSKVVYKGVTGYVLSSVLSEEKPEEKELEMNIEDAVQHEDDYDDNYGYLIANQSEKFIEEYITNYVRPLYSEINENISNYSRKVLQSTTLWYDNENCVKKELPQGAEGYNMSRQYYYDKNNGQLIFAFVFRGTQEHRLYFKDNELVRYIDEAGNVFDNPASTAVLKMAHRAINEAY